MDTGTSMFAEKRHRIDCVIDAMKGKKKRVPGFNHLHFARSGALSAASIEYCKCEGGDRARGVRATSAELLIKAAHPSHPI